MKPGTYKLAIEVQDACNPRAVARLLVEMIDEACNEEGTPGAVDNSAIYLVMDKLASLGLYQQHIGYPFSHHYEVCTIHSQRSFHPEWRCVRTNLYPEGTPPSSMQGHYIRAESKDAAINIMREKFPHATEVFGVELWKDAGEVRS